MIYFTALSAVLGMVAVIVGLWADRKSRAAHEEWRQLRAMRQSEHSALAVSEAVAA